MGIVYVSFLDDIHFWLESSVLLILLNALSRDGWDLSSVKNLRVLPCSILSLIVYNEWVLAVPVLLLWVSDIGLAISALLLRWPIFIKDDHTIVVLWHMAIYLSMSSISYWLPISYTVDKQYLAIWSLLLFFQ